LEQIAATLRDRVILAIDIPAPQHRALIGRGGQHLNEIQEKFNVQIQFPGSRSYNQVGEAENIAELGEVDAANIVKVEGSRAAVEKAVAELKVCLMDISTLRGILIDISRATSRPLTLRLCLPPFQYL
jgi:polyribonucleotide nucleotidyltransferase